MYLRRLAFLTFAIVSCAVLPKISVAGVVSILGQVSFVPRPNVSDLQEFRSDFTAYLYSERNNYVVPDFSAIDASVPENARLQAEIAFPGVYDQALGFNKTFQPGDRFDSYILAFGTGSLMDGASAQGTIRFDTPISAIMTSFGRQGLLESIFEQGVPALAGDRFAELELFQGNDPSFDSVTLSEDRLSVTFAFGVTAYNDNIRIFTMVPEPSSGILLLSGAVMAAVVAFRGRSGRPFVS